MASGTGIATVDFGASPNRIASVTVTGQAGIVSTDNVESFFQGNDSTADHPAETHKFILPAFVRAVADAIVDGVGFTITLIAPFPLRGTVKVRWVWAS